MVQLGQPGVRQCFQVFGFIVNGLRKVRQGAGTDLVHKAVILNLVRINNRRPFTTAPQLP
ncbi:uncharacterized protein ANIA_10245 [Aspergillus nidulans FGSC A4]|uniref:Uncharacterized protein n=1 Tax=Emericella nidulans (strain FGSC A4 / ATCC 38163 / CBS 112.46 / NRRL 194 / M139) TaxID=227321 RepID=C8VKK3_EMENI|nr:hypothetical protein [Aspergillus nidulans FGSC A4]CBF85788.1 TPA: hypothetical protein ANIA_10245 [Aspergillus nidulans FGSC A4]